MYEIKEYFYHISYIHNIDWNLGICSQIKCEYLFEVKYEYQIPEYSLREREIIKNVFSKILDNVNPDHPIYIEKVTEKKDSIIVDIMPVSALRLGKSRIEKLFGLFTIFTMFDYKTRLF